MSAVASVRATLTRPDAHWNQPRSWRELWMYELARPPSLVLSGRKPVAAPHHTPQAGDGGAESEAEMGETFTRRRFIVSGLVGGAALAAGPFLPRVAAATEQEAESDGRPRLAGSHRPGAAGEVADGRDCRRSGDLLVAQRRRPLEQLQDGIGLHGSSRVVHGSRTVNVRSGEVRDTDPVVAAGTARSREDGPVAGWMTTKPAVSSGFRSVQEGSKRCDVSRCRPAPGGSGAVCGQLERRAGGIRCLSEPAVRRVLGRPDDLPSELDDLL